MLRTLVVTLLFFAAAAPALAGPQERANELFVEAVKLIQAGNQAPEVERRLEYVEQAQVKLHRIIADYPSSDLAVQLISGQRVGAISLQSVRSAVEAAELEVNEQRASRAAAANEQRASRAAAAIEALLMRLAASKTAEEGEPIAVSIEDGLTELSKKHGPTSHYQNLRQEFWRHKSKALEKWAGSVAKPVEELLSRTALDNCASA